MMVFNGIAWNLMVFWYSIVFISIQWYSMEFDGIKGYYKVFDCIQLYSMELHCMLLYDIQWYQIVFSFYSIIFTFVNHKFHDLTQFTSSYLDAHQFTLIYLNVLGRSLG